VTVRIRADEIGDGEEADDVVGDRRQFDRQVAEKGCHWQILFKLRRLYAA
jgi:hypothetical protein